LQMKKRASRCACADETCVFYLIKCACATSRTLFFTLGMSCGDDALRAGRVLNDASKPLKERFRALFVLRNLGGEQSVQQMVMAFDDPSALLKHEVAYCLGQMGHKAAVPTLERLLADISVEAIVRHEAGEALGAINDPSSLPVLKTFSADRVTEVADTCQLAVQRMEYFASQQDERLSDNPYRSVDPAPPSTDADPAKLRETLLDEEKSLFQRYRAMFALRNLGDEECVQGLAEGLKCKNTLLRHEVAYVLGQIQSPLAAEALKECLRDSKENDMVRHECAEALGSITEEGIKDELGKYLGAEQPAVLRESCVVALDMNEYETSGELHYADTLVK